jgi:ZIP family zinc transporter
MSTKALLNAVAVGILLFLFWDVLTHAIEPIETALEDSVEHGGHWGVFLSRGAIFFACLGIGLLSLVYYDSWLGQRRERLRRGPGTASVAEFEQGSAPGMSEAQWLAVFIATGIGLHNFSEGLAIGQSAAAGELSLALTLMIGFGLHNATEGFGIIAPLSSERRLPAWAFLGALGLIGGGPTFLGTIVGRAWVSEEVSIAFLGLAAGSILYVVNELFHVGQVIGSKRLLMWGLLIGLSAGIITDWTIEAASEGSAPAPDAVIRVTETDFALNLETSSSAPGRLRFDIDNQGATKHEFVVVQTDVAAADLPVDGGEVDERQFAPLGEVEDIAAGEGASLTLDLAPGHYVFFCNLPGHYLLGMHSDFTVRP